MTKSALLKIIPLYYNNTSFKLELRCSNIVNAGTGVFAMEEIKSGTIIGKYQGEIKATSIKTNNLDYSIVLNGKYYIDAQKFPRCYIAMVNDAYSSNYNNNCIFKKNGKSVYLIAVQDINKGDELFVSYGHKFWQSRSD